MTKLRNYVAKFTNVTGYMLHRVVIPQQPGETKLDRQRTLKKRQAVIKDKDFFTSAHNAKIITIAGVLP
jgi:hypothetical protein